MTNPANTHDTGSETVLAASLSKGVRVGVVEQRCWRGTGLDEWPVERWREREGRCNAPIRKGHGPPCWNTAGKGTGHLGTGHCVRHGGRWPSHEVAGRRALAAQAVERLGLGVREADVSPAELLLRCNRVAAYDCEVLAGLVASLEVEPGTTGTAGTGGTSGFVKDPASGELVPMRPELKGLWGPTYHLTGVWTGEGKPHPYWEMHERAQKRAADVSATCLKLKLKEEQSQANKQIASAVADVLRVFAQHMGHSVSDPTVKDGMRQALTLMSGVQAP